jgi:protein-S-isoprenylcysteine O-methyltransferase Ste14
MHGAIARKLDGKPEAESLRLVKSDRPARWEAFEQRLRKILINPWVDKSFGIGLGIFYLSKLVGIDVTQKFTFEQIVAISVTLVLGFSLMIRRTPKDVSANPWVWLFVLASNQIHMLTWIFNTHGTRIVPREITSVITVCLSLLIVASRLNLGRNIGLVPARRELVTKGLYGVVRHPIYAANELLFVSALMSRFSVTLLLLCALGFAVRVIKANMEESFLSKEEDYRAYMKKVRYKFFPGIY